MPTTPGRAKNTMTILTAKPGASKCAKSIAAHQPGTEATSRLAASSLREDNQEGNEWPGDNGADQAKHGRLDGKLPVESGANDRPAYLAETPHLSFGTSQARRDWPTMPQPKPAALSGSGNPFVENSIGRLSRAGHDGKTPPSGDEAMVISYILVVCDADTGIFEIPITRDEMPRENLAFRAPPRRRESRDQNAPTRSPRESVSQLGQGSFSSWQV